MFINQFEADVFDSILSPMNEVADIRPVVIDTESQSGIYELRIYDETKYRQIIMDYWMHLDA